MNPSKILETIYDPSKMEAVSREIAAQQTVQDKLQGEWNEWLNHPKTEKFTTILDAEFDTELHTLIATFESLTEMDIRVSLAKLKTIKEVKKATYRGEYNV